MALDAYTYSTGRKASIETQNPDCVVLIFLMNTANKTCNPWPSPTTAGGREGDKNLLIKAKKLSLS